MSSLKTDQNIKSRLAVIKRIKNKRWLILAVILLVGFMFISGLLVFNTSPSSPTTPSGQSRTVKQSNKQSESNIASELEALQKVIKPFDASKPKQYRSLQRMYVQFALPKLIECYLSDNGNKNTPEYTLIDNLRKRDIDWSTTHLPKQGYYETETCFVAYLNPNIGFTLDNYREAANFAEMIIWRVLGDKIKLRKEYSPSANTEVVNLPENPQLGYTGEDAFRIFGFYDETTDKIYINTEAYANKDLSNRTQLGWRLLHEYLHSLASPLLTNMVRESRLGIPEEMFVEHLNDLIAARLNKEGTYEYSPAMKILLTQIDNDEVIDNFFNGSTRSLKDIIDSKTYRGAFCSFGYYLSKVDPYGHKISPQLEGVFLDSSLKVPQSRCSLE